MIGAEPRTAYDRIQLSPVLAGEKTFDDIVTHSAVWFAEHGVETRFGRWVETIDREAKTVVLDDGEALLYDQLVLATGSDAVRIPFPGADLPGVITFRDFDDVDAMLAASSSWRSISTSAMCSTVGCMPRLARP